MIIQETDYWVAVNKRSGIIVEKNPFEQNTVEDFLENHYRRITNTLKVPFLGIVHRLDKVTSGVLLVAKKKTALKNLNQQFSDRSVKKTYLAIVEGQPPLEKAILTHFLLKNQKEKRAIIAELQTEGSQLVELSYQVIKELPKGTLLEVIPKTGKFHQIRAQLSYAGFPIAGDVKYNAKTKWETGGIGLHAWKLQFKDPNNGKLVMLEAEWGKEKT